MEEKDREIWVGENLLSLGEDNILYETLEGEHNERITQDIYEATNKLIALVEGKLNILVDLNKAGKSTPEARKLGLKNMSDERLGKIALFGLHPVARVLAAFMLGITRKKDIRFFRQRKRPLPGLRSKTGIQQIEKYIEIDTQKLCIAWRNK